MELCGAGCMGFVNVAHGLRAIGYIEPDPLPAGPVALVTHSGSVFSAMLRSGRAIGFTLAVSSGQELVTAAAAYLEYALALPETRVLALVLEAIREPDRLRPVLAGAAARDIPVVLLTVGSSASGQAMVAAHSGALAAEDGGWEALADAYGVHRVGDLAELADTLELFAIGRRAKLPAVATAPAPASQPGAADPREPRQPRTPPVPPSPAGRHGRGARRWRAAPATRTAGGAGTGIATVHDSGLERAHAVDLAEQLGVPFAAIGEPTLARLADLLDPGLRAGQPARRVGHRQRRAAAAVPTRSSRWPTIRPSRRSRSPSIWSASSTATAPTRSRCWPPRPATAKPVAVLTNLASAVDQDVAGELRRAGIPVLEGMRTGLLALRHLLDHAARTASARRVARLRPIPAQAGRRSRRHQTATAPAQTRSRRIADPGPSTARSEPGSSQLQRAQPGDSRARRGGRAGRRCWRPARPPERRCSSLLREYGIAAARTEPAADADAVLAAAAASAIRSC